MAAVVRLVGLFILGGCGFYIGGSSVPDAPTTDDARTDGAVDDAAVDMELDAPTDGPRTDWWEPAWTHRRRITLATSAFPGAVTNFPVLVRLPALAGIDPTGKDLRFVSLDNATVYPYELDSFAALGNTSVWVRMSISQSVDTELWVYYANPAAPAASSGAMVFGADHVSVHHMGSLLDSSGNNHIAANGNVNQLPGTLLAGRVGAAKTFDGVDDFLALANGDSAYDFTTELYASAWIRVAGFEDAYQAIIAKGDTSWRMARANTGTGVSYGWTTNNATDNVLGDTAVTGGEWHHVAVVQTPTVKSVYVDGALDNSVQDTETIDTNSRSVRFGMNEDVSGNRFWHGDIDEVRISATARDAAWIFAEHATTAATFSTVGVDEPY